MSKKKLVYIILYLLPVFKPFCDFFVKSGSRPLFPTENPFDFQKAKKENDPSNLILENFKCRYQNITKKTTYFY